MRDLLREWNFAPFPQPEPTLLNLANDLNSLQAVFTDARREIRGVDPQIYAVGICIYLNSRNDGFQNSCIMSGLEARVRMLRARMLRAPRLCSSCLFKF